MKKHDGLDIILIIAIAIYNLAIIAFTLLWIFTNTFQSYISTLDNVVGININEHVTYSLFFSGALGGAFYGMRALYQNLARVYTPVLDVDKENPSAINMKPWSLWYLYRPIQGGVLALVILALVNSQLITIDKLDAESLKSYYTLIAIGFMCGFGSHEVIHKIQEVVKVVFSRSMETGSTTKVKVEENQKSK